MFICIYIYNMHIHIHIGTHHQLLLLVVVVISISRYILIYARKGGWYGWKPSSSSNLSIRALRARISRFELFEFIPLLKLDNGVSIEQFEPTVSQSTVPSPPLLVGHAHCIPHDCLAAVMLNEWNEIALHPVSVRRFPSFRTQPLENLTPIPMNK